jgi:hypothetical protein
MTTKKEKPYLNIAGRDFTHCIKDGHIKMCRDRSTEQQEKCSWYDKPIASK